MDDMMMDKMKQMKSPCTCGSGKMGMDCCMKSEADMMMDKPCPCGSGKMCKECHMMA